ncbi:hypothetical protein DVH05_026700 [Phytophthora capsici]|nr:hypothetical protein DVH05_026700 [Phytophthora capsici]
MSAFLWVVALLALVVQSSTGHRRLEGDNHWPSLRFHFSIKRSSMLIHGHSDFSILANPRVSSDDSSMLYDTFSTFTEDSNVYNFTFVDGVSYISSNSYAKCSEWDKLPSINAIVSALSTVSAVSTLQMSSGNIIQCSGDRFKVSVNGVSFALCSSRSSGFSLYGDDMDITVKYADSLEDIRPPVGDSTEECGTLDSSYTVSTTGKSLLTGQPIPSNSSRTLKADFSLPGSHSCSCKSTPRPCIFIHGQGVKMEMPENQDSFPTKYWGNMTDHAPCCTSIKYAVLNTVNHSWTENSQLQKVCDRALAVSSTSVQSRISDTIIITHSMGALMLGGAIASGKCSLAPSTTWISTGAPMRGSMGSDYLQGSCQGETNLIVEKLANVTGRCPVSRAIRSLAYEGGEYASTKLNRAYKAARRVYRKYVKAAMCSSKYSGLVSNYQWQFWLLGKVVPHKSPHNDGMVEFYSCAGDFPESQFGSDYRDKFYVTKLNHFDVAFQSGDALLDKAKIPLKWFECLL